MLDLRTLRRHSRALASDLGRLQPRQLGAFAVSLPRFLRERVTVQSAEEQIRRALDARAEAFLSLARTRIYDAPDSPYRPLLEHAGCAFSDLQAHVGTVSRAHWSSSRERGCT